jgi:hypothetical protein
MRKVIGDEFEVYLFSFKKRSDGHLPGPAGPMLLSKVAYNRKLRKMEFWEKSIKTSFERIKHHVCIGPISNACTDQISYFNII